MTAPVEPEGTVADPEADGMAVGRRWTRPVEGGGVSPERDVARRLARDRSIILGGILVAWEVVARFEWITTLFLPPPTRVAGALVQLATDARIREATASTLLAVALAFSIAAVVGILLGSVLGRSPVIAKALYPAVAAGMAMPKAVFLPLFLLVLGVGGTSKVSYGAFVATFFVTVNVTAGVQMLDVRLLRVARSLGASRRQLLVHVVLPGALPSTVTGLWYGLKHAVDGVLLAELLLPQGGVGFWIRRFTFSLDIEGTYALLTALVGASLILGWSWRRAETALLRGQRGAAQASW